MSAWHSKKRKPHGNRQYDETHVQQWRDIMRAEGIKSYIKLSERVGVSYATLCRLLSASSKGGI